MTITIKRLSVVFGILTFIYSCGNNSNNSSKTSSSKKSSSIIDNKPLDTSSKSDSLEYRNRLITFLNNPDILPDSLIKPIDSAGIPGLDYEKYTSKISGKKKKSKINFKNGISLISKTGKSLTFTNVKGGHKKKGKQFKFCAYDNMYNTLYMSEIHSDSDFVVFGVCLNTGDIFDLWEKDSTDSIQSIYSYAYSPNYRWLLKTAVKNGMYSCLLVDVSTGNEMTFIENSATKFTHFTISPKWINNTDFSFTEVSLEYVGNVNNEDYSVYLNTINKKSVVGYKLKNSPLKGTCYEYRIKPGYTSTELIKKSQVVL